MGACNSGTINRKTTKFGSTKIEPRETNFSAVKKPEIKINPQLLISELMNQVIIKHINDINGNSINIEKCKQSTIIIMDNSSQIIINDCYNCNIFIAPCKGNISLNSCEDINIISASRQFRCSDISNCKASIYVNSKPSLEKVKNFHLGCFFFMYTELLDLFSKSYLSVWDNCWSEYQDYTQGENKNISYFDPKSDINFINNFTKALKDQEISVDQYFPVPFTYGLSLEISKDHKHLLFIFKESFIDQKIIYELLNEETIKSLETSLIKSKTIDKNDNLIKIIPSLLIQNNKRDKAVYFENDNGDSPGLNKFSSKNNFASTFTNFNNSFVILWLVNQADNFFQFTQIIENEFENCLYITEEDIGTIHDLIKKIFKL